MVISILFIFVCPEDITIMYLIVALLCLFYFLDFNSMLIERRPFVVIHWQTIRVSSCTYVRINSVVCFEVTIEPDMTWNCSDWQNYSDYCSTTGALLTELNSLSQRTDTFLIRFFQNENEWCNRKNSLTILTPASQPCVLIPNLHTTV